ncbi:hypothetical protein E2C01_033851 [Portunus trituberculatus]|uniref:Uncharacterized protein n=1 Tax=Portunus trituberculatus TaxID=210409 RepID=A0A5B7F3U1_PORTR|nr:hypothetical protein [Portunus trituberculatus]
MALKDWGGRAVLLAWQDTRTEEGRRKGEGRLSRRRAGARDTKPGAARHEEGSRKKGKTYRNIHLTLTDTAGTQTAAHTLTFCHTRTGCKAYVRK